MLRPKPLPHVLTLLAWLKQKSLNFSGASPSSPCREPKVLGGYSNTQSPSFEGCKEESVGSSVSCCSALLHRWEVCHIGSVMGRGEGTCPLCWVGQDEKQPPASHRGSRASKRHNAKSWTTWRLNWNLSWEWHPGTLWWSMATEAFLLQPLASEHLWAGVITLQPCRTRSTEGPRCTTNPAVSKAPGPCCWWLLCEATPSAHWATAADSGVALGWGWLGPRHQ